MICLCSRPPLHCCCWYTIHILVHLAGRLCWLRACMWRGIQKIFYVMKVMTLSFSVSQFLITIKIIGRQPVHCTCMHSEYAPRRQFSLVRNLLLKPPKQNDNKKRSEVPLPNPFTLDRITSTNDSATKNKKKSHLARWRTREGSTTDENEWSCP